MRKIIPILLLFPMLFGACQFIDKQIPSENELLDKELKAIKWDEVDEFPSVGSCDSVIGKDEKKQCFFDYLTQLIQLKLSGDSPIVGNLKTDTIQVKVTVLPDATLQFEPQFEENAISDKEKIDSILKARLVDFPEIHPALKRGMPVKTQFLLPVILKVE